MARGDRIRVSGIQIEWQPERGVCTFENLPVAMMWVDTTLRGLMQGVQAMVGTPRFVLALQSEGRRSVEADWEVISRFPDFRQGFAAIARIAAVAGWGRWELAFYDPENRECRFRVRDSWEGAYQRSMGVSWGSGMLAGKLAGYCSKLFGTNCWADQTAFAAAGDECDEFEVKPSSKMIETELEGLLATDEATRADMAVALRKLQGEIAERIKIEGSLRESEARFRALLRAASDGIHVLDKNGNVVEVNDAFCRMLGYTREELLQLNVRDWDAQRSPEELAAKCNELITGSGVFETRHRRKDGTVLEVEVGGVGMTLDNRRLICASARDITDRKRAEELLRENDERYQALIRTSMDGFWICNPEGRLLDVNDAYCAMSGYPREELLSKSISNLDCTESPEQVRQHLCQIVVRGFDRYETQHCRRDGRLIDVEVSSVYLAARGVFLDFIHDITERKRAEKALRESEERYRLLAENVSDVIWILDLETSRFRYVSPSVERLRGFTAEKR